MISASLLSGEKRTRSSNNALHARCRDSLVVNRWPISGLSDHSQLWASPADATQPSSAGWADHQLLRAPRCSLGREIRAQRACQAHAAGLISPLRHAYESCSTARVSQGSLACCWQQRVPRYRCLYPGHRCVSIRASQPGAVTEEPGWAQAVQPGLWRRAVDSNALTGPLHGPPGAAGLLAGPAREWAHATQPRHSWQVRAAVCLRTHFRTSSAGCLSVRTEHLARQP